MDVGLLLVHRQKRQHSCRRKCIKLRNHLKLHLNDLKKEARAECKTFDVCLEDTFHEMKKNVSHACGKVNHFKQCHCRND